MATGMFDVCQHQLFCTEMGNFSRRMLGLTALTLRHGSLWVVNFCNPTGEAFSKRRAEGKGVEEIILASQAERRVSSEAQLGQFHGPKYHLSLLVSWMK